MSEPQRNSTPERDSAEWAADLSVSIQSCLDDLSAMPRRRRLSRYEMSIVRRLGAELKRIAEEMEGPTPKMKTCRSCKGQGFRRWRMGGIVGGWTKPEACLSCQGRGMVPAVPVRIAEEMEK
jgi:hypothetical protein